MEMDQCWSNAIFSPRGTFTLHFLWHEATSKPNASTIRELKKYVHKICTRGGLGLELNC